MSYWLLIELTFMFDKVCDIKKNNKHSFPSFSQVQMKETFKEPCETLMFVNHTDPGIS